MKAIKQETLEESALKFANDNSELYETSNHASMYFGFYWGAKWQQERMYSEEDLEVAYFEGKEGLYSFNDWIKQFKNK